MSEHDEFDAWRQQCTKAETTTDFVEWKTRTQLKLEHDYHELA